MAVDCVRRASSSSALAFDSPPRPWQVWLWPNLLSLDAPVVAVLWQILLARDLAVHVSPGEPLVLGLCVWLVYVADRIFDVLRPRKGEWEPARKTFYRHHLRIAATAGMCLLALIIPLAYCVLRGSTFYAGLMLSVPLIAYFALIHLSPIRWRARWPRELVIASLFTSGTFLAIWTRTNDNIYSLWAPAFLFFLLCWANCSAIETWEWQRNISNEESAPSRSTRWAARSLIFIALGISGVAAIMEHTAVAPLGFSVAALLSGIGLAALAAARLNLPMNALRVGVDLSLCTPLLILIFPLAK